MSLTSASGLIGNTKEYIYRGIQQLPLILSLTSFFLTVTTGSIAHATLFGGLAVVMPLFTLLVQFLLGKILSWTMPERKSEWSRSMVDVCKIIPGPESFKKLEYYTYGSNTNMADIPSYWITSIGFVFGYFIANGGDTLDVPVLPGADRVAHDKRYTQAVHILVATSIMFALIVGARFYFMGDCEGRGSVGKVFGALFGTLSIGIGVGFYYLSKVCGARSSDLFGVLSQMLPASAMSPTPIACTQDTSVN
jgi:hypothetical protein